VSSPSDFDRHARQLHAASLASLSPQTLARLRNARQASGQGARRSRSLTWLGATACTMLLAVLAARQLLPPRPHGAAGGRIGAGGAGVPPTDTACTQITGPDRGATQPNRSPQRRA